MTHLEESDVAFDFGAQWHVFELDDHRDYREGVQKIQETEAVDFLGIWKERELYLIEVKNFRRYRIANKEKLASGALAVQLAQKVRDSLACIVGASRTSSTPEHWQPYAKLLGNAESPIKVILWLEHDLPSEPILRKKALASVRVNTFKQKLIWLTNRVFVGNCGQPNLPDVQVTYLPRPPIT